MTKREENEDEHTENECKSRKVTAGLQQDKTERQEVKISRKETADELRRSHQHESRKQQDSRSTRKEVQQQEKRNRKNFYN